MAWANAARVPYAARQPLALAIDELLTNLIVHAYRGRSGPFAVFACHDDATVVVIVRDRGPAFDPTQCVAPDLTSPVERRAVGGLGLWLVRDAVDRIDYRRTGSGNQLTLTKRCGPAPAGFDASGAAGDQHQI